MAPRELRPALIERFPCPVRLPQPNFDDARRSGWLEWFCARLERILVARAAADLVVPRRASTIVVLPSWVWVTHAKGGFGVPIRVAWSPSPVVVVPAGETSTFRWDAVGLGHTGGGVTSVTADRRLNAPSMQAAAEPIPGAAAIPHAVTAPVMPASRARRVLASLVADGEAARWEAITALEPRALEAVRRAHAEVAAEVGPAADGTCLLLDRLDVQALADRMLLGDVDTTSPSPVARLIERCLSPTAFVRVDPRRYVTSALRVYATEEIRRAIGDPHVGPKVRAAAAALGTTDVDAVIAYYQARRPADRLGRRRAEAALDILRRATGPPVPFAAPEAS